MEQLRNPLVDNLTLNKEDNKAMKQEPVSHDYSRTTNQTVFKAYLEKWKRVEKENLEVKKKLKKMEKYNTDCKTELQKFVKRFKEFKNTNKDLVSKNKQLVIKNQQMRRRIAETLKSNTPQMEDLQERVTKCCENQKKQELQERITEKKILTQLKQENQTLREKLELNGQVLKDAESRAERVQQELERCLFTVLAERNLLRQEVKRLHEEYISLTNSISLQMKTLLHSSKQQSLPVNHPVGGHTAE